jgi:hypothetical protein
MINNTFTNSSDFGFYMIGLEEINGAIIDNFVIDNVIAPSAGDEFLLY